MEQEILNELKELNKKLDTIVLGLTNIFTEQTYRNATDVNLILRSNYKTHVKHLVEGISSYEESKTETEKEN